MFTKGLWKSKKQHSLEYLKYLYSVLCKNQLVTEKNRQLLVEVMRLIAEIVIWGDQNDSSVTDFFLEKNILGFFLRYLRQKSGRLICVQLLQTLNILFENISDKTSMYYLLSNNHINALICHRFDFSDEEVMAYYILFLKTLSLKLDKDTINFFYNQYTDDFALYTEAIKFFDHPESMVRIAVRTITLNVYRVQDKAMLLYIQSKTADPYFENVVWSIGNQILDIDSCVRQADQSYRLDDLVEDHMDHLFYLCDILSLNLPSLNAILNQHLLNHLLLPLHVYSLFRGDLDSAVVSPPCDSMQKHKLLRASSLFLLTQVYLVLHNQELINKLTRFIFVSDISIFDEYIDTEPINSESLANSNEDDAYREEEETLQKKRCRRPIRAFLPPAETLTKVLERTEGVPRPGKMTGEPVNPCDNEDGNIETSSDMNTDDYPPLSSSAELSESSSVESDLAGAASSDSVVYKHPYLTEPIRQKERLSMDGVSLSATMTELKDHHLNENESLTLKKSFTLEGKPFLSSIFNCLVIGEDDYESLLAICLLYAIVTNKGIMSETLHLAHISAPNENIVAYNTVLVELLINIINNACKINSIIRLVTLDMASLLLRILVDSPQQCYLHDDHIASIEGSKEESTRVLRSYFTNDDAFLDIFEEESLGAYFSPLTRAVEGRLVLDANLLVYPKKQNTDNEKLNPSSLILNDAFNNKRQHEEEQTRRAIRVWLQMCRLSNRIGLDRLVADANEESLHSTSVDSQTFVQLDNIGLYPTPTIKLGDKLDLNHRDIIACTIDKRDGSKKERRFLVMDPIQIILVEPDIKKLGWGVASFVGDLQHVSVCNDKDDTRALLVTVQRPMGATHSGTPLHSPSRHFSCQLLFQGSFIFEDHIRCMAAKHRLTKGRQKARQMKLHHIARLLEIPSHVTDVYNPSSNQSSNTPDTLKCVKSRQQKDNVGEPFSNNERNLNSLPQNFGPTFDSLNSECDRSDKSVSNQRQNYSTLVGTPSESNTSHFSNNTHPNVSPQISPVACDYLTSESAPANTLTKNMIISSSQLSDDIKNSEHCDNLVVSSSERQTASLSINSENEEDNAN